MTTFTRASATLLVPPLRVLQLNPIDVATGMRRDDDHVGAPGCSTLQRRHRDRKDIGALVVALVAGAGAPARHGSDNVAPASSKSMRRVTGHPESTRVGAISNAVILGTPGPGALAVRAGAAQAASSSPAIPSATRAAAAP
jgi:hypothetical protein